MRILSLMLFAVPALVQAQAVPAAQAAPAAHTKLSNEHAIIAATLPLPADMRADATARKRRLSGCHCAAQPRCWPSRRRS